MIKFRAWEIAGKSMVLVGSIDFRNKFIEYTYIIWAIIIGMIGMFFEK